MRFVYLEAGSGAKQSVTPEMVATVRKVFDGFIIVGGGIKAAKTANSHHQGRGRRFSNRNVAGANQRFKKIHRNGQINQKINL